MANISRSHNFEMLTDAEWIWIADEIRAHPKYKMISLRNLFNVIKRGIRGEYNEKQFCVNAFTIFKWLELAWENYPEYDKAEMRRNFATQTNVQ